MKQHRLGVSRAPALKDGDLDRYGKLIAGLPECEEKQYLVPLYELVTTWDGLDESNTEWQEHAFPGVRFKPLSVGVEDELRPFLPTPGQIDLMSSLFNKLPLGDLRNVAFHLLWFAVELTLGREPLTSDRGA